MKRLFTLLVLTALTFTTAVGAQDPPKHNDLQKQICEQTQPSASFNFEAVQVYEITAPAAIVSPAMLSTACYQAATPNVEICRPVAKTESNYAFKFVQPIRSTIRMLHC